MQMAADESFDVRWESSIWFEFRQCFFFSFQNFCNREFSSNSFKAQNREQIKNKANKLRFWTFGRGNWTQACLRAGSSLALGNLRKPVTAAPLLPPVSCSSLIPTKPIKEMKRGGDKRVDEEWNKRLFNNSQTPHLFPVTLLTPLCAPLLRVLNGHDRCFCIPNASRPITTPSLLPSLSPPLCCHLKQ